MKTYKIKINHPIMTLNEIELTEEQIIELHSRLQNKGEKYFFPKENEEYYVLTSTDIGSGCDYIPQLKRGVYRTEEQAKKEDEKRLALVRLWKFVQENGLYFEPDFSLGGTKFQAVYNHCESKWSIDSTVYYQFNFLFPHFKTREDCQKFIDNNLSYLNLFV